MGTKGRLSNGFCVYSGARAIMKIREQRRRIYTTVWSRGDSITSLRGGGRSRLGRVGVSKGRKATSAAIQIGERRQAPGSRNGQSRQGKGDTALEGVVTRSPC